MASRVLFVCSGNICRSPLAEYLARSTFSAEDFMFESAGTVAVAGLEATPNMITAGSDLSVDLRSHRSRKITDVDQPDLVLCMEDHHVATARNTFPDLPDTSIRLIDIDPVADPYGNDLATYRTCATQIAGAIDRLKL